MNKKWVRVLVRIESMSGSIAFFGVSLLCLPGRAIIGFSRALTHIWPKRWLRLEMRDTNSITAVLANESEFLQPLSKPEAGQWWAYIGTGPLLRPKHLIFKAFVNSRQLHPLQSFLFIRASWHIRLILLLSWKQPECLMAALANFKGDLFFPIWAESKQCKAKTRMYNY